MDEIMEPVVHRGMVGTTIGKMFFTDLIMQLHA